MAKLHSLLVLQQFMRSLGEDMEEAELVRSIKQNESKRTSERTNERIRRTKTYERHPEFIDRQKKCPLRRKYY